MNNPPLPKAAWQFGSADNQADKQWRNLSEATCEYNCYNTA